jgi:ATP-dependent DNA helicase RecG
LAYPWARHNEAGIEYELDPVSRLEGLVAARERDQVEYKRKVPEPGEGRERLMKAVCSFANGAGGSILIGVDDNREIFGVGPGDVDRISEQLTQMVGSWIEPRPVVTFNELTVQDTPLVVLEMWVEPATNAHCGAGRPGETKTAYVRRHSCSEKATISEIQAIRDARTSPAGLSAFNAYA